VTVWPLRPRLLTCGFPGVITLLAMLVVVSLMSPVYGPLLDHHFAERLPGHGHVYPGGVSVYHAHPDETPHHHHPVTGQPEGGTENGIIFLPPHHDGVPSFAMAFAGVLPAALVAIFVPLLELALSASESVYFSRPSSPEPPPPRPAY
jgi:hypothetical protein